MNITYYGHSCFEVEVAGKRLLFDPFITPNPLAAKVDITSLQPDYIFVSHGHFDHVADVEVIARQSGATIVACFEVAEWFRARGLEKMQAMNSGGTAKFNFGSATFTNAIHSSSMPDGSYGGQPGGFLVKTAEGNFYYSGDTALYTDMKLLRCAEPLLFAVLCIGDHFTMGIQDAITAAEWIDCKEVIGEHYDTFPPIVIDHADAQESFKKAGLNLHLMPIGSILAFN